MAADTTAPRTRRALLTAAAGGVAAAAATSIAVRPMHAATGDGAVVGMSNTGTSETGFRNNGSGHGLSGEATDGNGFGVLGLSNGPTGVAVRCEAFGSATALQAFSNNGLAVDVVKGRIRLRQNAGEARIKAGKRSVVVRPDIDINTKTFILLTPMSNIGDRSLYFTKNGNKDQFAIRISRPRNKATNVAWLALERA